MSIKTLLVSASDDPGRDARLNLACDLAAAFDAHVIGVGASALVPAPVDPYGVDVMTGELQQMYREVAETDVQTSKARFVEVVGARTRNSRWIGAIDDPADVINAAARSADLILVPAHGVGAPARAPNAVEVITGAGRPVLVVPNTPFTTPLDRLAIIAWKDSRESRLAAAAALPLLKKAGEVQVLTVCGEAEREGAEAGLKDVAAWLGRHKVKASTSLIMRNETPTAQRILDHAAPRGAGLIVSGAYGHARLREWVLGGVTRSLLADSHVCLLTAH